MWRYIILPFVAFPIGALGTLVGVGGGIFIVPLLLFLFPEESPELVTSISLAVVLMNSASGSVAYVRQRRIDYLVAGLFALGSVPGASLGALTTGLVPRAVFEGIFAVVLWAVAAFITIRPETTYVRPRTERRGEVTRTLTDVYGNTYLYSFRPALVIVISLGIGFISSLLGVGGGIMQVPLLIFLMRFPTRVATATSQLTLVATAATATIVHLATGQYIEGWRRTLLLMAGVIPGAQLGARLSTRWRPVTLVRVLAAMMTLAGIRLFMEALGL